MDKQTIKKSLDIPVLFIIFNRPQTTAKVFESIRKVKPERLFIAGDGPRNNKSEDKQLCSDARNITKQIDWPCKVKTLFQEKNLGCGHGVSTAINWFFDNVEYGIILEDDCLPNESFYYYCQELLEYYKNNNKIMHISGNNFQYGKKRGNSSYYFSEYTHIWGWATWKRAWNYYDFNCISPEKRYSSWDKQWLISVNKNNGLSILPNVNLVSNIGFGNEATHTPTITEYSNLPTYPIIFPLIHPKVIRINLSADLMTHRKMFNGNNIGFLIQKLLRVIPEPIKKTTKYIMNKI